MAKTFNVSPGRTYIISAAPGSTLTSKDGRHIANVSSSGKLEYVSVVENELTVSDNNAVLQQSVTSQAGY